jgi:hypothetical protein
MTCANLTSTAIKGLWILSFIQDGRFKQIRFYAGNEDPSKKELQEILQYPNLDKMPFREAFRLLGQNELPKPLWKRSERLKELLNDIENRPSTS